MTLALELLDRGVLPLVAGGVVVLCWILLGLGLSAWFERRRVRADALARRVFLPAAPWAWVYGAPVAALATFGVLALAGLWIPGIFLAAIAWMFLESRPRRAKKARTRRFDLQFVDALMGLSNSLKAGMSLPQALEQVSRDVPAPVSEEFADILREYGLGKTIDQAFADAAERIDSRNYDLVSLAFRVGKQRGGNLAEVFEKIAASIREIWRLEENIRTVSTEGRSSARFMTAMPPLFLVLLWLMDAKSMMLLFTDPVGIGILTVVVLLNVLGQLWIRKILDVDV